MFVQLFGNKLKLKKKQPIALRSGWNCEGKRNSTSNYYTTFKEMTKKYVVTT